VTLQFRGSPGRMSGSWGGVTGPPQSLPPGCVWVALPATFCFGMHTSVSQLCWFFGLLGTWQSWGQGFEPPQLHQLTKGVTGSPVTPLRCGCLGEGHSSPANVRPPDPRPSDSELPRGLPWSSSPLGRILPWDTGMSLPALICGETGTGKELIARANHNLSPDIWRAASASRIALVDMFGLLAPPDRSVPVPVRVETDRALYSASRARRSTRTAWPSAQWQEDCRAAAGVP